jgi:hypothetical protein
MHQRLANIDSLQRQFLAHSSRYISPYGGISSIKPRHQCPILAAYSITHYSQHTLSAGYIGSQSANPIYGAHP